MKHLKYIFISVFAVLLMSHNTYADVLSIGVSPKWTNWQASWQYYVNISNSGVFTWGSTSSNTVVAASDGSLRVKKIRFNLPNGLVLVSGDYITAEMVYNLEDSNNSNDMIFGAMKSDTSGIGLIDVTANRGSNAMGTIRFTFKVEDTIRVNNTSTFVTVGSSRGGDNFNIFWFNEPKGYLQGSVVNFYGTKSSTDYSGGINDLKNGVTNLNNKLNDTNKKIDNIADNQEERAKKEDKAIDNIDNQDPSDIDSGDSAGATSLLNNLGAIFNVIKDTPATNCQISGDLGHVDMGNIDLCSGKEHFNTLVEFIGFTCLFGVVFWAAYHLVKRTIGLIDWARSK